MRKWLRDFTIPKRKTSVSFPSLSSWYADVSPRCYPKGLNPSRNQIIISVKVISKSIFLFVCGEFCYFYISKNFVYNAIGPLKTSIEFMKSWPYVTKLQIFCFILNSCSYKAEGIRGVKTICKEAILLYFSVKVSAKN